MGLSPSPHPVNKVLKNCELAPPLGGAGEPAAHLKASEGKAGSSGVLPGLGWGREGSLFSSQPLHEAAGDGTKDSGADDEGNPCTHQQGHEQGVQG